MLSGSLPLRFVVSNKRWVKFVKFPIEGGIEPMSGLYDRSRIVKLYSLHNELGIDDVIELFLKERIDRLVMFDIKGVIVPYKLLLLRFIPIIDPFLSSH